MGRQEKRTKKAVATGKFQGDEKDSRASLRNHLKHKPRAIVPEIPEYN